MLQWKSVVCIQAIQLWLDLLHGSHVVTIHASTMCVCRQLVLLAYEIY